jgi:predicted amidohydrolase YtcJ
MLSSFFAVAVVLANATVLTQSPSQPKASHVAWRDEQIVYVGDNFAQAKKAAGADAQVLDLKGKTVLPGFNDAHVHFGLSLTLGSERGVEVDTTQKNAWLKAVRHESAARPDNGWLFITSRNLPAGLGAADLETLGRPVLVVSAHGGLINKKALERAKLAEPEMQSGFIRGRSLAAVLDHVVKSMPMARLREGAKTFLAKLGSLGITSVQLIDELPELFEDLRKSGELTARVRFIPVGFRPENSLYEPTWKGEAPNWVRVDGVKYFHDSGARVSRYELRELYERALHAPAGAATQHLVFHVVSLSALTNLLDTLEALKKSEGSHEPLGRWFRFEHVDEVDPTQAQRLERHGIIVCSNPAMIPEFHTDHAFPMRTLLDAKVRSCIGTDWVGHHTPERPLAPLASVALAVTHGGYGTRERISAEEALEAYTVGTAVAEGMSDKKGALTVGHFADLTVLSDDPTHTAPENLGSLEVLLTVVGGRIVYRSGELAPPETQKAPPSIGPRNDQPPTIGPTKKK